MLGSVNPITEQKQTDVGFISSRDVTCVVMCCTLITVISMEDHSFIRTFDKGNDEPIWQQLGLVANPTNKKIAI